MENLQQSAEKVAAFMRLLTTTGGFRLKYRIVAGAGASDPAGLERREIYVECKGPDDELLLDHDAELLRAFEHVAAKILRLEPQDHDLVSFDADGYKAERAEYLEELADKAEDHVEDTDEPYHFPSMNSRERRMLHMLLKESEFKTSSTGEGPRRHVVLYPADYEIPEEPRRGGFRGRGGRGGRGGGGFRGGRGGGGGNRGGRGRY